MRIEIRDIVPMGAVRTTKRSAGRTAAGQQYAAYKDRIGWEIKQHIKEPLTKAIGVKSIMFLMPIPKSKQGKVMPQQWHTVKPDIDNLVKGLFDAANGIAWVDDNRVAYIGSIEKIYHEKPGIIFEVEEIGGLVYGQAEHPKQTEKAKQRAARKEKTRARRNMGKRV